jgi:hypothetical protein
MMVVFFTRGAPAGGCTLTVIVVYSKVPVAEPACATYVVRLKPA